MSDYEDDEGGTPYALRNFRPVHELPPDDFWGPASVRQRLVDGARIIIHTTGKIGPRGYGNGMPSEMLEALSMGGASDRKNASINVTPRKMTLAEQANNWAIAYLTDQPGMRRVLALFVFCKAYRMNFKQAVKNRGWARATAYRRRDEALRVIAEGLNRDHVPVEV